MHQLPPYIRMLRRLLLIPWPVLERRILTLQQSVIYCRRWGQDWELLTPFHMAHVLDESDATLSRLRFLLDGRMADRHGLAAVLMMNDVAFLRRHPGYALWQQRYTVRQAAEKVEQAPRHPRRRR